MVPDVTIVIPVWNGADFVGHAIQSALAQEGVAVEVIVIDDASSDSSAEAAEAVGDPRVKVVRHVRNQGPGAARNTGFRQASGRWIAVLDADDTMQPDRLRKLVDLAEHHDVEIVADNLWLVPSETAMFKPDAFPLDGFLNLERLVRSDHLFKRRWTFGYLKPLFRRDFIRERRLAYRTDLQIGEDFMFLAECLAVPARMRLDAVPRYNYLVRDGSTSARTQQSHIEQMLRSHDELSAKIDLTPEWRKALRERRLTLEAGKAYLDMVDQVKQGRFGAALRTAIAFPRGAALFRLPLAARLRRALGL